MENKYIPSPSVRFSGQKMKKKVIKKNKEAVKKDSLFSLSGVNVLTASS